MEVLTHGVTHVLRPDILELLVGLVVLVPLLVLAGLILQVIGSARDARRFPPRGQLVDVGGHRLHIYCMGRGTPAVVMDSGFPGSSLSWTLVQPEVARFTHACSYDRAGLGWSDAGPMPRSSRQIVEELRALLLNARVEGPFVLVGHSFGKLPSELRPIIAALWTQPKFFDAIVSQAEALPQSAAQVAATGDYSDIPLVVLSASSSSPSQMKGHEDLVHLSSQGKHIVASKSGHWIQLDEPDLVIESIREVVESVRRRSRTTWSARREAEREERR